MNGQDTCSNQHLRHPTFLLFVREYYQGQALPLVVLWQGIGTYLNVLPGYRYLIGVVGISHRFSSVSKAVMLNFIKCHCFDSEQRAYLRPRKCFRYWPLDRQKPTGAWQPGFDYATALQHLVASPEPGGMSIPAPLQPYIRQQARFIDFNLHPGCGNTLDGLVVLDASALLDRTQCILDRYEADRAPALPVTWPDSLTEPFRLPFQVR